MSPQRMRGPAYWASGGGVEGRSGPLALGEAMALLAFLGDFAESCGGFDDSAAGYCADIAIELGRAIARAVSWRNCGGYQRAAS